LALIWFLTFTAFAASRHVEDRTLRPTGLRFMSAGWLLASAAVLTVLTGTKGALSVYSSHERHVAQRACLQGLRGPLFSVDGYLALPWMTEAEPRFVLFYTYHLDRKAGREFERDGIAGLIRERYFASVVMPTGSEPQFEGARLDGYVRREENCAGLDIYTR
jgi:hypothetical protein